MPFEDGQDPGYNSMQQQAGLLPAAIAVPPPVVFPGQIAAALSMGGPGAAMSILPANNIMAGMPGFGGMAGYPSPAAMMGPQTPNPYMGMMGNPRSAFSPAMPPPPPMYAGPQMSPGIFGGSFAPSLFNTPYAGAVEQEIAESAQNYANRASYAGLGARVGAVGLAGLAGAYAGGKFGGGIGAAIGGLGAMFGMEHFGAGAFAQNTFMEQVMAPRMQQAGFARGIEHLSAHFMPVGSGPLGVGFSASMAERAAESLQNLGNSSTFRRETFDRFNASDVAGITQGAAHAGLMSGVGNVEQMTSRVRDVAKSLSAFMELAQEPDIQRALQTMGNLRTSGLNLSETLGAVQSGRAFARMAGTSFQEMLEVGGSAGAGMFQNFGMSAGAGTRAGMANLGMATMGQNAGYINPALMSALRGPQGLAAMYNQFSANMMGMPMLAPAMMTAGGGLNVSALQSLAAGGGNLFSMTGIGANNLSAMASNLGVGGLGMAVSMQPMLRDQISRILQSQGPFAQRNVEDSQILGLARGMGMRGTQGFITAARIAGLDENAAMARAMEVTSPTFYAAQRQEAATRMREAKADAERVREQNMPGVMDVLRQSRRVGGFISEVEHDIHGIETGLSRLTGGIEAQNYYFAPSSDLDRRRQSRLVRSGDFARYLQQRGNRPEGEISEMSLYDRMRIGYGLSQGTGRRGLLAMGEGFLLSGAMETATGGILGTDKELPLETLRQGARVFAEGGRMSQQLLHGTMRDEISAMGQMEATFGGGAAGERARSEFARRVATMGRGERLETMVGNAAFQTAFNMLPTAATNFISPGNLFGGELRTSGEYRQAFIASMRAAGRSEQEAARIFDRNPNLAIQQVAPEARLMMTDVQREGLEQGIELGQSMVPSRSRALHNFEEDRRRGAESLLGHSGSRASARALMSIMGNIEGVGPEGSAKAERTRHILASLGMANAAIRRGSPAQQESARRIIQSMSGELRRTVSREEYANIMSRAEGVSERFLTTEEGTLAARNFSQAIGSQRTAEGMLSAFREGETLMRSGQAGEDVVSSLDVLGNMGGPLADLARDRDAIGGMMGTRGGFSEARLSANIDELAADPSRMAQLQQQGRYGRVLADALRRHRRGDPNARGQINELLQLAGQQAGAEREKVRDTFGYRVRSAILGRENAEGFVNREVASAMNPTSSGERGAASQLLDSAAAEIEMRNEGIGGAGDPLLSSARELREAAQLFRDTISSAGMRGLLDSLP
jgi:hypothetical protein